MDLVDTTLVDQPIVLIVTDLALFTSFELLPGLLFDHSRVGIQVLPLQTYFLELLGQTGFLFSLLFLFVFNLAVHLEKALLTGCLSLGRQCSCIVLFFHSSRIILGFPPIASLFNLFRLFHQLSGLLFLACQIGLPLELHLLHSLSLVELKALS